jgi:hypothetical protein
LYIKLKFKILDFKFRYAIIKNIINVQTLLQTQISRVFNHSLLGIASKRAYDYFDKQSEGKVCLQAALDDDDEDEFSVKHIAA